MLNENLSELEELRRRAGMTLAEVAERAGYSVGAVQGLEKHNKGARRLRETVMRVLNEQLMGHISAATRIGDVTGGTAEEKQQMFERAVAELTAWRQRARRAASEMKSLALELNRLAREMEGGEERLKAEG